MNDRAGFVRRRPEREDRGTEASRTTSETIPGVFAGLTSSDSSKRDTDALFPPGLPVPEFPFALNQMVDSDESQLASSDISEFPQSLFHDALLRLVQLPRLVAKQLAKYETQQILGSSKGLSK